MGGFRGVALVVGLSCGCTSHTSQLQPFVRNIQTSPQGMIVDSCVVEYQEDHNYVWFFLGSHNSTATRDLREGGCTRQVVPMEVAQ